MVFSWPKTLKCTLLVVVVHMLHTTYPSCASQSRGYYDNGYNSDNGGYKPSYSYNTPYYPTPSPPPYKDEQSEQRYYSNSSPDKDSFLQVHNSARSAVGLAPLSWDDRLASYAQSWANRRVNDCRLVHSDGPYGENIFWGSGGYSAAFAVQSWVNERKYYDYSSNSCRGGMDCGHYTQIIWKRSTRLGCARVTCNNGGVFVTCNYDPPGNYIGMRPY